MVEPISTTAAALMAAGSAAQGAGSMFGGMQGAKATRYSAKKQAKEQKRKTLADLLNEALRREYESGEMAMKRQQDYRGDRAKVMQNLASQYVQALR